MKKISIVTPCYNEIENIPELVGRIKGAMSAQPVYDYEIIIIDNFSTDGTRDLLREMASYDHRLKIILNTRNFGHIRSPYYGLLSASGDAAIYMASDLQDPPELIGTFISEWNKGYKLVLATKPTSSENKLLHFVRKTYYRILDKISDVPIVRDFTGFGLYDKVVLDELRKIKEPYPFLRGIICELGYSIQTVSFNQPRRQRGVSKNNFYTLYDIALLGIVSHSKVPIRLASLLGFLIGLLSFIVAFVYLILKLIFWDNLPLGIAPIIIGGSFIFGVQMFLLGILGEYVGTILTYVQNRPIVVVEEKINFDD
ncbi:MAG: glycosyltransferase family 2 protein [Polynucleobacter sp.]|nr:glycosyltransferase family 2 protein [Polynucleobacter sp.]